MVFVDTNVLVYTVDPTDRRKNTRALEWIEALWSGHAGRVSTQVLKEFYNTVTRKLNPGLRPDEAAVEVRDLWAWKPVETDLAVLEGAWTAELRFGFSFWDALIVSAARSADCDILLTEDLQDGQDLDGLRVVSPFSYPPGEILPSG